MVRQVYVTQILIYFFILFVTGLLEGTALRENISHIEELINKQVS